MERMEKRTLLLRTSRRRLESEGRGSFLFDRSPWRACARQGDVIQDPGAQAPVRSPAQII